MKKNKTFFQQFYFGKKVWPVVIYI